MAIYKYIILSILLILICSCYFIQYETFESNDAKLKRLASTLNIKYTSPSLSSETHTITTCTLDGGSKGLQDNQCNNVRVQNELDRNKQQGEQSGQTAADIQTAVNSVDTINPSQSSQNDAGVSSQLTQINDKITVLQQNVTELQSENTT